MWKDNKWLYILPPLLFIIVGHLVTGGQMWSKILDKTKDATWWADSIISLVIFTVVGGFVVYWIDEYRDRKEKEPFLDTWLIITGFETNSERQEIYWRDAEKYRDSKFEKWKFIKSAMSTYCWIKTPTLADANKRWYKEKKTENGYEYLIDFSKIEPDKDVSAWNTEIAPSGFMAKEIDSDKPKFYVLTKKP